MLAICLIGFISPFDDLDIDSFPQPSTNLQEPTSINVILLKNHSINWFRAYLLLNVTVDIPINVSFETSGIGDSAELILDVNSGIFVILPESSQIEIFIQPVWNLFPKSLQYQLNLYYINATTQIPQLIFNISQGSMTIIMGIPVSIILCSVFLIGVSVISMHRVKVRKQKGSQSTISSEVIRITDNSNTPFSSIEGDYITCPECKKKIAEASAFCPECGYHIPRFLRTQK